ncbi:hypothetical protein EV653_6221 [Kribbella pratensis]|uniref:Uncharacterized protein n=1 Tax=Kribbella pratensis TaxID=2512112 RepID=A0A4V3GFC4_9ACTN|nr:hypothetical protein EV653_6221 [Kribbella pratensis]
MTWQFWRWRRIGPDRTGRCRSCALVLEVCEESGHSRLDYVHCFLGSRCPTHGRHWY